MLKKYSLNFCNIYTSNIIKKLKNENKKFFGQIVILKFLFSIVVILSHFYKFKIINFINSMLSKEFFSDTNFNIFLVLLCVLFGILVYYLVEKPSYKYLSDRFLNNEKKVLN